MCGTDELEAAIVAFEKANESIVSYEPDYTKALLIVPEGLQGERNRYRTG